LEACFSFPFFSPKDDGRMSPAFPLPPISSPAGAPEEEEGPFFPPPLFSDFIVRRGEKALSFFLSFPFFPLFAEFPRASTDPPTPHPRWIASRPTHPSSGTLLAIPFMFLPPLLTTWSVRILWCPTCPYLTLSLARDFHLHFPPLIYIRSVPPHLPQFSCLPNGLLLRSKLTSLQPFSGPPSPHFLRAEVESGWIRFINEIEDSLLFSFPRSSPMVARSSFLSFLFSLSRRSNN